MTPYVAVHFGFDPENISDPFFESTLVGDSIVTKKSLGEVWCPSLIGRHGGLDRM